MIPVHRLLVLSVMLCSVRKVYTVFGAPGFDKKVSILLKEEPENPKCLVENRKDFTCFWEEDEADSGSVDQYQFTYTYHNENSSVCPLQVHHSPNRKRLFFCHVKRPQYFIQTDIQIHRQGILLHNRSLLVELHFLLDPPTNVTVAPTGQQGQLNVSWVPPPLKYMADSMVYQVRYSTHQNHHQQFQVEVVHADSELILRSLRSGSRYQVQVRVTMDGISYSGFWSAWSEPVYMETPPAELDLLIVSLTLIISFILIALSLTVLLSHRRFVINKVWPTIPTPDSKFQGLFTVYGGDFQSWLGQTDGGFWSSSRFFYSEEFPSPLEVLSELGPGPSAPFPPLPPKKTSRPPAPGPKEEEDGAGGAGGVWRTQTPERWLMERLRALQQAPGGPRSQASLLESHDAYVTLSGEEEEPPLEEEEDPALEEEALPLEVLFSRKTPRSESHSDFGSVQHSSGSGSGSGSRSGSGRLSSQSSLELGAPGWGARGPGYTYMAVADSGVSVDYSPMSRLDYTHDYKNQQPHRHFLSTQGHFLSTQSHFHHGP